MGEYLCPLGTGRPSGSGSHCR